MDKHIIVNLTKSYFMDTLSVERTDEAILIRLPLSKTSDEIQQMLNFLRYIDLAQKNKIDQEGIDELAKKSNETWWKTNKDRFIGKPGFEEYF